jgi:two-component system, response regulator YesN
MLYKVFLVEDEIVAREGMRDNVDWKAHGFEFSGEAPDGEMALPLLHAVKPDVLITDIRMPFMDGLRLSQIVRDRMPTTKIIILSGHDEFEYAQKAIQLGVSEYLLKPVSVQDLHSVLQRVASELERDRGEQDALKKLRDQVEENRAALREKLLLGLVTGTVSSVEAIEKSQFLGIDLVARCYLVVILRVEPSDCAEPFDYRRCQYVQQVVSRHVENNPDVFLIKMDMEESALVLKGNSPEYLLEERDLLLERIRQEVEQTKCKLMVGSGTPQKRITDICRSFTEALDNLQSMMSGHQTGFEAGFDKAELLKVDKSVVEDYLRFGAVGNFDAFFETYIHPLGEKALRSSVVNHYIFLDIVLTTAKFVDELGGDVAQIIPEFDSIETILTDIETGGQLREQARNVLVNGLVFRDSRVNNQYAGVIKQAQDYIDRHYMDPDISLNSTAAQVNLSPCHFSAVFSQEAGGTFKEYLTEIRIRRAKELLRTTSLKTFEICYQIGYNDPHYFSHVFRKNTGLTPGEFRLQVQAARAPR